VLASSADVKLIIVRVITELEKRIVQAEVEFVLEELCK
jgi:hypothetical protein